MGVPIWTMIWIHLDVADKCPLIPEDIDGFEDQDGCPDKDNDQDGIVDARDRCPDQPENIDGIEDEDGCPEERVVVPERRSNSTVRYISKPTKLR